MEAHGENFPDSWFTYGYSPSGHNTWRERQFLDMKRRHANWEKPLILPSVLWISKIEWNDRYENQFATKKPNLEIEIIFHVPFHTKILCFSSSKLSSRRWLSSCCIFLKIQSGSQSSLQILSFWRKWFNILFSLFCNGKGSPWKNCLSVENREVRWVLMKQSPTCHLCRNFKIIFLCGSNPWKKFLISVNGFLQPFDYWYINLHQTSQFIGYYKN